MTTNTKTPAMVLQEFAVKKKINPPVYNLIVCKMGTQDNEFQYQVTVAGVSAIGIGRSKQVAKHDAAQKALEELEALGLFNSGVEKFNTFHSQLHRNEPTSPTQPAVDYIGKLKDFCFEHKLPPPSFSEISDVGPPHCRSFTWNCCLSSIKTKATANTKKQAKQLAARNMFDRVKDIWPELLLEDEASSNAIVEQDAQAEALYKKLSTLNVVPNKSAKVSDYRFVISDIMVEKGLKYDNLKKFLENPTKTCLQDILDKLGLQYEIVVLQQAPDAILTINLNTETPFSILGCGSCLEIAEEKALKELFETLDVYMQAVRRDIR